MRNHVSFRTDRFESQPLDDCTSPTCLGDDLAEWLLKQLGQQPETQTWRFSPIIHEDYGCGFWVAEDFWVAIGIMDESFGRKIAEWRLTVAYDAELNLKKLLFSKPDTTLHLKICHAVHTTLASEAAIIEIRWCDDGERDCGDTPSS